MQRREATYIYRKVVKRLKNEFPELPVITIHDSIATIPQCTENARITHGQD